MGREKMTVNDFLNFLSKAVDSDNSDNFDQYKEKEIVHLIKIADESARQCFFSSEETSDHGFSDDIKSTFTELSIKYCCYGISTITSCNFNTTVQNCDYSIIGGWFQSHRDTGSSFLAAYLKKNDMEPTDSAFSDELCQTLESDGFITMEWVRNVTQSPSQAKLILAAVKYYIADRYDEVVSKWAEHFPSDTMEQLSRYEWFDKYESTDTLYEYYLKSYVEAAVKVQSNVNNHEEKGRSVWSGSMGYSAMEIISHHEYDLGSAVLDWLNNGEAAKYGLRSSNNPNNHVDETSTRWREVVAPTGCLSPETMILMSDGSEKPVRSMQPGDHVMSQGGAVSECSDELVHNRRITVMYGINEWEPFLSPEHAVMTQKGWCSIMPEISNRINPHFHVSSLEMGDMVTVLSRRKDGGLSPSQIQVKRINVKFAKQGQFYEGYDLHFREGKNSYFANGFLCLLNYPEITMKRIMDNIRALPKQEQAAFRRLVMENSELFKNVFGEAAALQYLQEAENAEL